MTDQGQARATDPDTSRAAAKVPRTSLRERMKQIMRINPTVGYTGHQFAAALNSPLNSVTPRLAELRKAGVIYDSGERAGGQIVWAPVVAYLG